MPRYTAMSKGFATAMQYFVTALVVNQNIMIAGIVLLNIQYYIVLKKSVIPVLLIQVGKHYSFDIRFFPYVKRLVDI